VPENVIVEILDDLVAESVLADDGELIEVLIDNPIQVVELDAPEFLEVVSDWVSARSQSLEFPFSMQGLLQVKIGDGKYPIHGGNFLVDSIAASVGVAPGGQPIIVDINVNGVSVFTTQANRPTIPVGQSFATVGAWNSFTLVPGDYITVDVDQVGSGGTPGQTLTVAIRLERTT
jgi:hypothetical protein